MVASRSHSGVWDRITALDEEDIASCNRTTANVRSVYVQDKKIHVGTCNVKVPFPRCKRHLQGGNLYTSLTGDVLLRDV